MTKSHSLRLAAFLLAASSWNAFADAPMHVGAYEFTWHVGQAGQLAFDIVKTDDSSKIVLRTSGLGMSYFSLPVKDAAKISAALATAPTVKNELKADDTRNVQVGDYRIMFTASSDRGFTVTLGSATLFVDHISMKVDQAATVATWLAHAQEMNDFLNAGLKIP